MKGLFVKLKNKFNENKNRNMLILVIIILTILSSITLITYSFYQNRSSNLIIAGVASIDKSDVRIKVYREDRNSDGVGTGTYSLSYYIPEDIYYTYKENKNSCDSGISITKYENSIFYVEATKKGTCKVYFDAIDGYIDDYKINLFVQEEIGSTDDKNYKQMGQLPLYEVGYYYTINENKTPCYDGKNIIINGKNISIISSSEILCNVYVDKVQDNESPTISDFNISSKTITATLNDNAYLYSYGISENTEIEPENWKYIDETPYSLNETISGDGTYYLWVKDSAGNILKYKFETKKKASEIILANNGGKTFIESKKVSSFASGSIANDGMYMAQDDLGASYYFRGAVNNNWVKFGKDTSNNDMYWRIIRINGDGSIRMIYSGIVAPTSSTSVVMNTSVQIAASTFNSTYNAPYYVGFMYTANELHGLGNSSTIKNILDNWFRAVIFANNETKNLVTDAIYCNDRSSYSSITGGTENTSYVSSTQYFGPIIRDYSNKVPSLKCPNNSDKFTMGSIGNGALTYPVGLITSDEAMFAGGIAASNNTAYYLKTNSNYWTMSPGSATSNSSAGWMIDTSGSIRNLEINSSYSIRPVISLSKDISFKGSGTYDDVYEVN